MGEAAIETVGMRCKHRSGARRVCLFVSLVLAASLVPSAASFLPQGSNPIFGGEAQAACKHGLSTHFSRWYGHGQVVTNWCYNGRSVTSRHSRHYEGGTSDPGAWRASHWWSYSNCHYYNGISNHNCLTHGQFTFYSPVFGYKYVCAHTRIYGNGAHRRNITDGLCPSAASGRLHRRW